ncbi:hypothetical protein WJX84_002948 [Apatococcus fuscideae]|uniref:DUF1664 domain-containing protein n=1 Tax=Apatococcus fuscideae TaxID=2026836 RepID=A0AAW1SU34_9CHLO
MAGRVAVAALAGAGGAAAYANQDSYVSKVIRQIWDSPNWQHAQPTPSNTELDRISRMVEHLSRDMGRQNSVTILRTDKTGSSVALIAVGIAGAGYLYLRFWCGLKLSDLMYVTKASLCQATEGFNKRLDSFKSAVQTQMSGITSRQKELSSQQKESMEKQENMGEQLSQLGTDVESLGSNVGEVNDAVQDLRGKWDQMRITQEDALLGIHALCGSVQDLMYRAGVKSQAANKLEAYIRKPRSTLLVGPQGSGGLSGLLEDASAASGGRLLGDGSEPRLGILQRAMSMGASVSGRQGNSRAPRGNSHSNNVFSSFSDDRDDRED